MPKSLRQRAQAQLQNSASRFFFEASKFCSATGDINWVSERASLAPHYFLLSSRNLLDQVISRGFPILYIQFSWYFRISLSESLELHDLYGDFLGSLATESPVIFWLRRIFVLIFESCKRRRNPTVMKVDMRGGDKHEKASTTKIWVITITGLLFIVVIETTA